MPIEILTLLLGLVIGIIAYLILRSNTISKQEYDSIFTSYNEYKNSSILLQERNLKLNEEFKQLQNKIETKIQENATLGAEKASLQSALEIIKNQAQQVLKEVQEQKYLINNSLMKY